MADVYILNGPDIGRSFKLREGVSFSGRSFDNDIRIDDKTVSRKHLKIVNRNGKVFVTDLKSRNGTYFDGKYLDPGCEVEVEEGMRLALAVTVIGLGGECKEQMTSFLDTVTLIRENWQKEEKARDRRAKTREKRLDLLANISMTLKTTSGMKEALAEVLGHILHFLKRIDRGAVVLVDPLTLKISESICRSSKRLEEISPPYCEEAVQQAMDTRKPVVYSKAYTANEEIIADTLKILKIESVLSIPLISGSKTMGVLYLDSLERPDGFRMDDLLVILEISQRIALAMEETRVVSSIPQHPTFLYQL
jgi:pSer/pThr/pTyr-binding forkhead associated (FHA) protein